MPSTTISINHLSTTEWKTATDETFSNNHITTIWRVALAEFASCLDRLKALLPPEEIKKANRCQQETDRQRYLIGKAVLRILLSRYLKVDAKHISFKIAQNKKPELENVFSETIHFNISHSGNWVSIAISNQTIGIDVEAMNASFTYQNLMSFTFNKAEKAFIENADLPHQSFYQLWTRKESLLKATGKGLVDELSLVPSLNGVHQNPIAIIGSAENWQVSSFNVDENHVGSVAFLPIKTALQFFNFRL